MIEGRSVSWQKTLNSSPSTKNAHHQTSLQLAVTKYLSKTSFSSCWRLQISMCIYNSQTDHLVFYHKILNYYALSSVVFNCLEATLGKEESTKLTAMTELLAWPATHGWISKVKTISGNSVTSEKDQRQIQSRSGPFDEAAVAWQETPETSRIEVFQR